MSKSTMIKQSKLTSKKSVCLKCYKPYNYEINEKSFTFVSNNLTENKTKLISDLALFSDHLI